MNIIYHESTISRYRKMKTTTTNITPEDSLSRKAKGWSCAREKSSGALLSLKGGKMMKEKIAFLTEAIGRIPEGEGLNLSREAKDGLYQILSEINDEMHGSSNG